MDDFAAKVPSHLWPTTEESAIPYTELPMFLAKWQNPKDADSLTRVQEEVEETKIILVSIVSYRIHCKEELNVIKDFYFIPLKIFHSVPNK